MVDGHSKTLYHYTLIRSLSRLLHSRTNHGNKTFPCPYCLHRCYTQQHLDKHILDCSTHKECRISFPSNKIKGCKADGQEAVETLDEHLGVDNDVRRGLELAEAEKDGTLPDNILHFKNIKAMQKCPIVLYSDFECFVQNDGEHVPSGFALYRVSSYGKEYKPYVYSGANVMDEFFARLEWERKDIEKILKSNVPMRPLTPKQ